MKKINQNFMAQQSPDIAYSGSIIAEFPNDEEVRQFTFGHEIVIFPLRENVLFTAIPIPVRLSNPNDLEIAEKAYETGECVLGIALKKPDSEANRLRDFYSMGCVCRIAKIIHAPHLEPVAFVMPGPRARLKKIIRKEKPVMGEIAISPALVSDNEYETKVLFDSVREAYAKVAAFFPEDERGHMNIEVEDIEEHREGNVAFMISTTPLTLEEKAELLAAKNFRTQLELFLSMLDVLIQKLEIQANIHMRTHQDLNQQQRTHFLQQQLRTIQEELGEKETSDLSELREKAKKMPWNKEARAHFDKELTRLERISTNSPDYAVQFAYLETLLSLPWEKYSPDNFALTKVEKILDRDHYGLEQVKERIIEHMAVLKLRNDMKSPIICLYGPPGVGKTSLGRSIADALGREYARVSLGGVHDEAEIRGHRRTYVGAMPGRIISALQKCGTSNPVFVLDEIDKMGHDFKGDPSTALLEVLDPEQNSKFHDNYLGTDYDLSKILFIATANNLSEISRPLLDRMEIIEMGGYIPEEKIEIAKRHLVPKSLEEHGFSKGEITFADDAIRLIIERYTRESGVRQLEKKIAKALRKIARLKASQKEYPTVVTPALVKEYLGKEEVNPDRYETNKFAGVVTGLAWTQVGGEILFIECSLSNGNGEKLTLTGNLGDVMKESAAIALQYLKAHAERLGIDPEAFNKKNIHIHVPEGAIPKDGPSAGVTMATAIASAFTGRKVKEKLAMTGEITLRGKVLPVGGIKEKILAAKRAGITDIILSSENAKDIAEINERYLKGLTFHYVETVEDVLNLALLPDLADYRFPL